MMSDPQAPIKSNRPADAVARSWVDGMPVRIRPFLQLMRLDRPIGVWLLFWPCLFGLILGAGVQGRSFTAWDDLWTVLLFGLGAIVMRGAGCTFNDIVDRDIDAQVARTRGRPLPSGAIGVRTAWLFLALQCLAGLIILLQFNLFTIVLGAASLLLVAAYPFMKRITWWPQAWLGLTFNWGALLGFAAMTGEITPPALLLYAGCFFWTLGYDTIYALQDVEDDALIGVRSTARLFGADSPIWIMRFYAAMVALIALAGLGSYWPAWGLVLMILPAGHLFWQLRMLDMRDGAMSLKLFRANRETGALIAGVMFVLGIWN